MLISILSLLIGFGLLIWSADTFTDNGAKIASIFNVSPLIIGLLIFGFGTSAPEMLVSGLAALDGHPELSIGNAFGSNIFNIGLVLAVTAIIYPVTVEKSVLKKEWVFLFFFGCGISADGWLLKLCGWIDPIRIIVCVSLLCIYRIKKRKQ